MLMKIVPKHLNEIKQYQYLGYLEFREKLIEVFEEPDKGDSLSQCPIESLADT